MEALFRELIETNKEILNEIRLLRKELAGGQNERPIRDAAEASPPAARPLPPWRDEARPAPARQAARPAPSDLGLQESAKSPPPRYSAQDLEDLRGALLDGVKQRNKEKRDAFAEFEKLHKR